MKAFHSLRKNRNLLFYSYPFTPSFLNDHAVVLIHSQNGIVNFFELYESKRIYVKNDLLFIIFLMNGEPDMLEFTNFILWYDKISIHITFLKI